MRLRSLAATLLLTALPAVCSGRSTLIAPFITHVEELQEGLTGYEEYPLAVQLGRGFISAPLRAVLRCLTPLEGRVGFYDQHTDPTHPCVMVVVLMDTSRAESTQH